MDFVQKIKEEINRIMKEGDRGWNEEQTLQYFLDPIQGKFSDSIIGNVKAILQSEGDIWDFSDNVLLFIKEDEATVFKTANFILYIYYNKNVKKVISKK